MAHSKTAKRAGEEGREGGRSLRQARQRGRLSFGCDLSISSGQNQGNSGRRACVQFVRESRENSLTLARVCRPTGQEWTIHSSIHRLCCWVRNCARFDSKPRTLFGNRIAIAVSHQLSLRSELRVEDSRQPDGMTALAVRAARCVS